MSDVLVCGSRSIDSYSVVRATLDNAPFEISKIIHGGAEGVDSSADSYAALNDIETQVVDPNYEVYGKGAPLKRNQAMVEMADAVVAIWDGESSGTEDTIRRAIQEGVSIYVEVI